MKSNNFHPSTEANVFPVQGDEQTPKNPFIFPLTFLQCQPTHHESSREP